MASAKIRAIVYDPPAAGLPYLAVAFIDGDEVIAVPFSSHAEADAYLTAIQKKAALDAAAGVI